MKGQQYLSETRVNSCKPEKIHKKSNVRRCPKNVSRLEIAIIKLIGGENVDVWGDVILAKLIGTSKKKSPNPKM